ncbi:MAG: hypothetical protein KBT29_04045 [Prevotellaceae bacterium]|nr:hypothetical protein [Candidatus Minthosoma caballi]
MKKITLKGTLFLAASALALTSVVSCSDYTEFTENEIKRDLYNKQYDEEFVKMFGEPAEGHDWGMKLLDPVGCYGGTLTTRATEDNVNTSRNQWCDRETSGKYKTYDGVLINTIKVPGWPNFDGFYYGNRGTSAFEGAYKHDQIFTNDYINIQPCGDVTDYEINYVSTWFRTHKNPISTPLHLTDFFIQNISQDNDQLWYNNAIDLGKTRMEQGLPGYPKSNQIGPDGRERSIWWNGDNADYVNDVVKPNTNDRKDVGTDIQVSHQDGHLNSNERLNYSVDYLHFGAMDRDALVQKQGLGNGWTHVNNFNNNNSNFDPEKTEAREFREIKFVHSAGTEDFACRSSMDNTNTWINNWVLVHLEWEEPGADGVVRPREGYYLGFDFSGNTNDTKIEADGFYSNWIVKISPAYFAKSENTGRVMCEDLGGNFDFDFNDIVFDVAYDGSKKQAVICLMASGGTLPIVAGHDTRYEAHFMLGEENVARPVNVDAPSGTKREVAVYRIDATAYMTDSKLDISKIPILVKYRGEDSYTNTTDPVTEYGKTEMTDQEYESQYGKPNKPLTYPTGKQIPRKFVTAIGVDWMKELKCIDDGYQKFKLWVKTPTYSYEDLDVSDSETGQGTGGKVTLYWYDDRTQVASIYNGPKDPVINTTNPSLNPVLWQSLKTYKLLDSGSASTGNSVANFEMKNFAVDYITIASYPSTGDNSIIDQIKSKELSQPVTFAYITKAPESVGQNGVHAMIFPIWLFEETENNETKKVPYFVQRDGTKIKITEDILKASASYRTATWQSNFVRSGVGGSITPTAEQMKNLGQGVDVDEKYTFVSKYGYTKGDLYVTPSGESTPRYCDYVAFYVLEDITDNPYASAVWTNEAGTMGNEGIVKKYECYVIF